MPGRGPAPIDPSVRKRNNKRSTRAVLSADHNVKVPALPRDMVWHPLTRRWWHELWASPMATEFVDMDINSMLRVAQLYNDFWTAETPKQRAEIQIRLERADADYGTTPLARRRLEWQIEKTEQEKKAGLRRKAVEPATPDSSGGVDPRLKLA